MPGFSTFVRSTPPHLLRQFLEGFSTAPPDFDWTVERDTISKIILRSSDAWDPIVRHRIDKAIDRIWMMGDETGQAAVFDFSPARAELEALAGGAARALFLFLADPVLFQRAESARLADVKRFGRMWVGFQSDPGLDVPTSGPRFESFMAELRRRFETTNVHVEIYQRSRPRLAADPARLIQASIYQEDRLDEAWQFIDGNLSRRAYRPVAEVAITYEPLRGILEIVSRRSDDREDLLRAFSEHLLDTKFREERIGRRLYNLRPLLHPFAFPTDPKDGIHRTEVTLLRLRPFDNSNERITFENVPGSPRDIWSAAERRFGLGNPLATGHEVTKARLLIHFHQDDAAARPARRLPVTITLPSSCDLKDRTEDERLIGERYLTRWGLQSDA